MGSGVCHPKVARTWFWNKSRILIILSVLEGYYFVNSCPASWGEDPLKGDLTNFGGFLEGKSLYFRFQGVNTVDKPGHGFENLGEENVANLLQRRYGIERRRRDCNDWRLC